MATKNFYVHDGLKVKGNSLLNGSTFSDSASAKLHVKTAANGASANLSNVNGLIIENSGSSNSNYALKLATGAGNIFSITNAGRVGIGTTTPNEELTVVGDISASGSIYGNIEDLEFTDLTVSGDLTVGGTVFTDVLSAGTEIESPEFIGNLRGAVSFTAKAGEALTKGDVVYISGISGNTTVVAKADADDSSKMPAFGIANESVSLNASVTIINFGAVTNLDTSSFPEGTELFVGTTAGQLVSAAPTGESAAIQKIAKVTRQDNSAGSMTVMGAGRSNAVPNLNEGRLFVGNSSNQAVADDTLFVDIANSRVGIGIASPSQILHLEKSDDPMLLITRGNSNRALLGDTGSNNGGDLLLYNSSGSNTVLIRSGADSYLNGGNVGIGIAAPEAPLHILGGFDTNNPKSLVISGREHASSVYSGVQFERAGGGTFFGIGNDSRTDRDEIVIGGGFGTVTNASSIKMYTGGLGCTIGTAQMTITSAGDVGIGTVSPNIASWSNALTIEGSNSTALELMKGSSLYAFMGTQGSGSGHALDIAAYQSQSIRFRVGSNAGTTAITITSAGELQATGNGVIKNQESGGNYSYLQQTSSDARLYVQYSQPLLFGTAATERMRIAADGEATFSNDVTVCGSATFHGTATFYGSLDLQDNDKLLLGSGDDLEIYHNGSDSYISDVGTGHLILATNSGFLVKSSTEKLIEGYPNGAVSLYYDNSKKLETTSAGVCITDDIQIAGNLIVHGTCSTLNTTVTATSAMCIHNAGTGPALQLNQTGTQPIVDLQDDGTSAFYIEDGGNVGIGTNDPAQKLHVCAVAAVCAQVQSSSNHAAVEIISPESTYSPYLRFKDSCGERYVAYSDTDHKLHFRPSGTSTQSEWITFSQNGRLGLGTSVPRSKLFIAGGGLMLDYGTGGSTDGSALRINSNSNEAFIQSNAYYSSAVKHARAGASSRIQFKLDATNGGDITFSTAPSAAADANMSQTERMTIKQGGNVGIGTNDPGANLHIYGCGQQSLFLGSCNGARALLELDGAGNGDGSGGDYAYLSHNADGAFDIKNLQNNSIRLATGSSGTTRMTITSGGNVGIGTTAPTGNLTVMPPTGIANLDIYQTGSNVNCFDSKIRFQQSNGWQIEAKSYNANSNSGYDLGINYNRNQYAGDFYIANNGTKNLCVSHTGQLSLTQYGSGTYTGTSTHYLTVDSSGNVIEELISSGTPTGSGTTNYIPKWNSTVSLTDSAIYEDSGNIGIGTTCAQPYSSLFAGRLVIDTSTCNLDGIFSTTNHTNAAELVLTKKNSTNNFGSLVIQHAGTAGNAIAVNHTVNTTTGSGGTNSFRVTTEGEGYFAGSVGIGTASPSENLHISSPVSDVLVESTTANNASRYILKTTTQDWRIGTHALQANNLWIYDGTAGAYRVAIDTSGKVGIGTTNPGKHLTVVGEAKIDTTANNAPALCVSRNAAVSSVSATGTVLQNTAVYINGNEDTGSDALRIGSMNNGSGDYFIDASNYNATAAYNIILNPFVGNVGIGTTGPKTYAHIGKFSGGSAAAQEVLRLTGDYAGLFSGPQIVFTNQHNSGTCPNTGEYNLAGIYAYDSDQSWGGGIRFQTSAGTGSGGSALLDRMTINHAGKVGIGTTDPDYKLDVAGDARINDSGAANGTASETMRVVNTAAGATSSYVYIGASSGTDWKLGKNVPGTLSRTNFDITTHVGVLGLTINTGGCVGVGTTDTNYPLEVTKNNSGLISRIYNTNTNGEGVLIRAGCAGAKTRAFQVAATDDTKRFTVNSDGTVGIGVTNPAYYALEINSDISDAPLRVGSPGVWSGINFCDCQGTANMFFRGSTCTWSFGGGGSSVSGKRIHADGGVTIGSNYDAQSMPTDGLLVEGSVGIGITNPYNNLHVNGTARINGLIVGNSAASNTPGACLHIKSSGTAASLRIEDLDSTNQVYDFLVDQGVGFKLIDKGTGSSTNTRLAIDTSGNVGIGVTNPGALLEVCSAGTCATFTNIARFRSGPDANATGAEVFIGHQGNSRGLIIQGGRGGEGAIADDTAVAHFCLNRSGGAIPSTTQDHIMTFRQGGSVGIGTTCPGASNTGKLFVGTPPTTGSSAIAQFGGFIRTNYILTHDSNYGIHPNTTCTGQLGYTAAVYKCAHICKIIAYGGVCPQDDGNRPLGGSNYRWSNVHAVCTTTGAVIESNLCTPGIDSCPQGSVVVWRDGKLQGTTQEYDYNVMGVTAPDTESPIVMGAEPILVTGDIQEGDPIVTSSKINHGMKGDRACDLHGKVIAQALESGSGESYMIQGMIRKF